MTARKLDPTKQGPYRKSIFWVVALIAVLQCTAIAQTHASEPVPQGSLQPLMPVQPPPPPPQPPPNPSALIAQKYQNMGGASGKLGSATSPISKTTDGQVYWQHYQNGSIYWTPATLAEIHGEIWKKFNSLGTAVVGYPYNDVLAGPNGGEYSNFKKGSAYGSIYWKQGIGAFFVWSGIRDRYLAMGGPSALGYPTTDETSAKNDANFRYNHFEGGTITWKASLGSHEVHGDIWLRYIKLGGPDGFLGAAHTDESTTPDGIGRYNHFDGGSIYWTMATGAHEVHGLILERWATLGWEKSFLKYPISDETTVPRFADFNGVASGRYGQFQGGYIYYHPGVAGAVEVRDLSEIYGTGQASGGFHKTVGTRYVLTILIDPHTSPNEIDSKNPDKTESKLPTKEDIESVMFGTRSGVPVPGIKSSVRDYYLENSRNQLTLENAGIWKYDAPLKKQHGHYWDDSKHQPCSNDGWLSGHDERVADAITLAAADVDFKKYDQMGNGDGRLTPDELAIVVVVPGKDQIGVGSTTGAVHGPVSPTGLFCTNVPSDLKVDGVTISSPNGNGRVEWYTTAPTPNSFVSMGLPAHELAHLLTGIPDLYLSAEKGWRFDPGIFSRMSADCSACDTTHFDPFLKLKAGWLNYTVAMGNGTYTLRDVETFGEALIVYDPVVGRDEYFILEYRKPGGSYDAGRANVGNGLPNAGLAIWHVVEDSSLQKKLSPPSGADNWYRKGVLLLRANGGTPLDDSQALFTKANVATGLVWTNGSSSLLVTADSTDTVVPGTIRVKITR